jgi:hypothetical protein
MVVSSSNRGKWADVLTVVPIVSAVLATLIYLLRLYSRRLGGSGFMIEDALMGIGLLLSYGATIFVIYSQWILFFPPAITISNSKQRRSMELEDLPQVFLDGNLSIFDS